jgi:hypothetical protein
MEIIHKNTTLLLYVFGGNPRIGGLFIKYRFQPIDDPRPPTGFNMG